MSLKSPVNDPAATPPQPVIAEITEMNREFLGLLTHPAASSATDVLGLDAGILTALRELTSQARARVAAVPVLLAEFHPFPGVTGVRDAALSNAALPAPGDAWRNELDGFANRLLTTMWQTARTDPLRASLFMGVAREDSVRLAGLGFSSLSRCGTEAANLLRVRLRNHPLFWSDLVAFAHSGTDLQQTAARLAMIQLSVAESARGWPRNRRQAYA